MAIQFGNIGVVHAQLSDYVRALEYFGKALALHEELGNKALVANWLGNIGNVHYSLSDYARALEYLGKALALHEELGDKVGVANWLTGIGTVHRNFSDYARMLWSTLAKHWRNTRNSAINQCCSTRMSVISVEFMQSMSFDGYATLKKQRSSY
jgi:tetratricopeptide (TPR) repeat protein